MSTAVEDTSKSLSDIINDNIHGCELLLSLFISALNSYRVEQCLRPFPPMYVHENSHKDIDRLRTTCHSIPPLAKIANNPSMCSSDLRNLLMWIFRSKKDRLRRCSYTEVKLPHDIKSWFIPHCAYEIVYSDKAEAAWCKRKGDQSSFIAFHGSKLENFYSIMAVGLQQHFGVTKEHLYGFGIYLTTELSVSMNYSPFSNTWINGTTGKLSIIAVCEIVDNCGKVKCIDPENKYRSKNEGSISGNIPEKYYVVTDSDMVRVKYLFVYKGQSIYNIKSWVYSNIILLLLLVYFISLFCIGFFQQPTWTRIKRRLDRMLNFK